jgi:hypothetical protein
MSLKENASLIGRSSSEGGKKKMGAGVGGVLRSGVRRACFWSCNFRRTRFHLAKAKRWFFLFILATLAYVIYSSYKSPIHPPLYG